MKFWGVVLLNLSSSPCNKKKTLLNKKKARLKHKNLTAEMEICVDSTWETCCMEQYEDMLNT